MKSANMKPMKYDEDRIPAKLSKYLSFCSLSTTGEYTNTPDDIMIPNVTKIGNTIFRIES